MPLIKSSSKKAVGENLEREMDSGKPRKQALAIALDTQRRMRRKKMAKGGSVNDESAKYERRPMPENTYNDSHSVSRNSGNKPLKNSSWTDNSTVEQAQRPSPTKLSQPPQLGSDAYSSRAKSRVRDSLDRIDSEYPESDRAQPPKSYDELDPKRQGPKLSDMESQHNNHKPPYRSAKEDQYSEDEADPMMKKVQSPLGRYARGGRVDMEPKDHGVELFEREDELDLQGRLHPGEHGEQPDSKYDELNASEKRHPDGIDREMPHSGNSPRAYFSNGGSISDEIMRRRGENPLPEGQVDLNEHSEEAPNLYDPLNEEAGGKEQYDLDQLSPQPKDSNLKSDDIPHDEHDMISKIRAKMKRAGRGMMSE